MKKDYGRESISNHLRQQVLERDEYTCRYCGLTGDGVTFHIDHVYPVSKGGINHIDNLVTSCEKCNLRKRDKLGYWPKPLYELDRWYLPWGGKYRNVPWWVWPVFVVGFGIATFASNFSLGYIFVWIGTVIAAFSLGYEWGWSNREDKEYKQDD